MGLEAIAFEISKQAVGAMVKPALASAYSSLRSLSESVVNSFGDRFAEYVSQQAHRHSKLSTIVFGHQKSLEDLYIPLTVVPTRQTDDPDKQKQIKIDRFRTDLFPAETRVLVTDTAGMGKSTLSKFLFLQCLKSAYAIPIFIELRHLSEKNNIVSVMQKQLNSRPCKIHFQRPQTELTAGNAGVGHRGPRTAARKLKQSTAHSANSASNTLFSPCSVSFDEPKKATSADLAACATMARISQRML